MKINITISKSKLTSSIAWINLNFPICYNISKPQKLTWVTISTELYQLMPIVDIFSSYWSYLHRISESYRNDFMNLNEMRTDYRRGNPIGYWQRRVDFQYHEILKSQNSISWVEGITNKIMLFCLYNITKKYDLLLLSYKGSLKIKFNPSHTHVWCVSDIWQSYVATFCTKESL